MRYLVFMELGLLSMVLNRAKFESGDYLIDKVSQLKQAPFRAHIYFVGPSENLFKISLAHTIIGQETFQHLNFMKLNFV